MKRLILGVIATSLCTTTFAMYSEGVRIISETHKVTGKGATGWIVKDIKSPENTKYAHAGVNAYDARGRIKENIHVQANHFYNIINQTNRTQRYKVHLAVSCLYAAGVHDIELELRPGARVDEATGNFLTVQPTQKGKFPIPAETEVFGESHQRATDGKTLQVNG